MSVCAKIVRRRRQPLNSSVRAYMRHLFIAAAIVFASASCLADSLPTDHPIVGTWEIRVPGTTCTETYEFRADGTKIAKSAEEVNESKFVISATPSSDGYYKLTDTVVSSNGKPDCSGQSTPVGDKVSVYLRFEEPNAFSFCPHEAADRCIGPFKRISRRTPP